MVEENNNSRFFSRFNPFFKSFYLELETNSEYKRESMEILRDFHLHMNIIYVESKHFVRSDVVYSMCLCG